MGLKKVWPGRWKWPEAECYHDQLKPGLLDALSRYMGSPTPKQCPDCGYEPRP